jgi:hypothetical protein
MKKGSISQPTKARGHRAATNHHREAGIGIIPTSRRNYKEKKTMNWYIEKTTSKERRAICDTMLGLFVDLERANALLETVLDEQFSDREQAPLSASGADWTRSMLHIVNDIISDSILVFYLTIGDDEDTQVKNFIASLERAKLAMQCEGAHSAAIAAGNKLREDRRRGFLDAMDKISDMEDADAIAAIKLLDDVTASKEASV